MTAGDLVMIRTTSGLFLIGLVRTVTAAARVLSFPALLRQIDLVTPPQFAGGTPGVTSFPVLSFLPERETVIRDAEVADEQRLTDESILLNGAHSPFPLMGMIVQNYRANVARWLPTSRVTV